jgi:hypothetical protein
MVSDELRPTSSRFDAAASVGERGVADQEASVEQESVDCIGEIPSPLGYEGVIGSGGGSSEVDAAAIRCLSWSSRLKRRPNSFSRTQTLAPAR